jgi:hypothetical protein
VSPPKKRLGPSADHARTETTPNLNCASESTEDEPYCSPCGYVDVCTCDFYRDWVVVPSPSPSVVGVGLRAAGVREGFHSGTRDGFNRLWPSLDADARRDAHAIVASLEEAA